MGVGPALLQEQKHKVGARLCGAVSAFSEIVRARRLDFASHKRLFSFLQAVQAAKEDADDLLAVHKAPKAAAFESSSGGIMEPPEDMQKEAEDGLGELRKREMDSAHSFDMVKQYFDNEMNISRRMDCCKYKTSVLTDSSYGSDITSLIRNHGFGFRFG